MAEHIDQNEETPIESAQHGDPAPVVPTPDATALQPAEPMATTGEASASDGKSSTFKDNAANFAKQAADKARGIAADGKERATDALDEVSRLMGNAASTVDEKLGAEYGKYARTAADGIAGFAENLRAKEIDDLMSDMQGFVRKSPVVAIGVAAALGFVVARLVKAGFDGAEDKTATTPSGTDDAVDA